MDAANEGRELPQQVGEGGKKTEKAKPGWDPFSRVGEKGKCANSHSSNFCSSTVRIIYCWTGKDIVSSCI